MNAPLRRVAAACVVLLLALFVNSTVLQVVEAKGLRNNRYNGRVLAFEYSHERGQIVVGGRAIAESVATHDSLKYLRRYPGGAEYAPITGYYSLVYGSSGIEQTNNSILSGDDDRLFVRRLSDLITGRTPQGGAIVLTINPAAQDAAWRMMQGKRGAVVALDPHTGAVLALVTSPSYDPSVLSTHDPAAIRRTWAALQADPAQPMLDRALSQIYPPGSMFKIVTVAAAFSSGRYGPDTRVASPTRLPLPRSTRTLGNFGGESCGDGHTDTISDAFRISCNTAFGGLGLALGISRLAAAAGSFGIGNSLSVPLAVVASNFPANADAPETALSAIGQFNVAITPLQAALLGAAVADNGVEMKPYLVAEAKSPDLSTLDVAKPQIYRRPMSAAVAAEVRGVMELVVASGTGTAAQIPGITVAGKTGTAQHCATPDTPQSCPPPHAWFVSFAPAADPRVVVAVVVENGGGLGSDATGGAVAAPIARAVMCAVLGCR